MNNLGRCLTFISRTGYVWHHMYGIEVIELMFGNFAIPSD